jgi:anti-sigma regulatory factor (Ser/Thr protein kinase)
VTMVLQCIDPRRAQVQLLELAEELDYGASSRHEVDSLLRSMGLEFQIATSDGSPSTSDMPEPEGIAQSWTQRDGSLEYLAEVDHNADAIGLLDPYAAAVLATYGAAVPAALSELRLVIYELCQNLLEHGTPRHSAATVRLRLEFHSESIRGSIEDDCIHFDPLSLPVREIDEQLALRARRGYGLTLVRRALDEMHYTSLPTGNRVDFLKRTEA